ncbi:MAG: glycosyltransferase family 2 protein [Chloroflexia bacterium]
MTDKLGIVVVHYNTPQLLSSCLKSLRTCRVPHAVVVVDNASPSPEGVELVEREFPEARIIRCPENRGFAAACNIGLAALCPPLAGAPGTVDGLFLLLNADTVVQAGALETLIAFLEQHPRAGAAGPRLLNPDGSIQENAFTFPTLLMSFLDFFPLHGRIYRSRLNGRYPQMYGEEPFPIDHPLGACLLLRGEALAQVGLLDEGYFMYVEEVDLCYRLKRAGWEVWHVPTARVVHLGGQSTRQMPERMFVELHRSRYRFFHRYYPRAFLWAHRQITRLGLWWRAHRDRRAWRHGEIDAEEFARRLAAYAEIAAMR